MGRSTSARTLNWLTLVSVGAWLASLVIRTLRPESAIAFVSVDPVVLLIIGYWFTRGHRGSDRNGS